MRFASRRLSVLVAMILSLSVTMTLLSSAPSFAEEPLHQMIFTQRPVQTSGSFIGAELRVQYPNEKYCNVDGSYNNYKLTVKLVNETTQQVLWAKPGVMGGNQQIFNNEAAFFNTPVDYPGATFRAYGYAVCDGDPQTEPDASVTPLMDTAPFEIAWDHKVEIQDATFTSPTSILAHITDNNLKPLPYLVSDYGTDHATAMIASGMPSQCNNSYFGSTTPDGMCHIFFGNTQGETATYIGLAVVPERLVNYYAPTPWPVPGATSSAVADRTKMGGPPAIPSMTQGGPSKSEVTKSISSADPIDNYSGNFYSDHTDLSVNGRIGLGVERSYSVGNASSTGAFGYGTSLNYDMHVSNNTLTQDASITEENGNSIPFKYRTDSAEYATPSPVVRATLARTSEGWDFNRWGELLTYHFGSDGRLSSISDNNDNRVVVTRDSQTGEVTKVQEGSRWIQFGWLNGLVDSVADHSGRSFHYAYDLKGNLAGVRDAADGTTTYAYDDSHRITSITNTNGGVTSNIYDTQGRVAEQNSPSGQTIKMSYGPPSASGPVYSQETVGDITRVFTYIKGRITNYDDSADSSKNFTQSYDESGRLAVVNSYSDPDGYSTYLSYDNKGNVIKSVHSASNIVETTAWNDRYQPTEQTDKLGVSTDYAYDDRGNLISTTQQSADKSQSRATAYERSSLGDVIKVTNPLGGISTMSTSPDGDMTSVVSPMGNKTTHSYDSLGRKVKTVSPGGNAAGATDAAKFTTTYALDANDNITSVTGALGTTTYSYDARDNPAAIVDPQGKTSTTTYDAADHPIVVTHADGSTDTFAYDMSTGQRSSWTDSQGRVTTYRQRGSDVTTTAPDGTVSKTTTYFSGDIWGSSVYLTNPLSDNTLVRSKKFSGSNSVETTYSGGTPSTSTFAPSGLKTSESTPSGGTTSYAYDGFGAMTTSTSTVAGRNVAYTYDAAGNITQITYPDGTSVSMTLDKAGRVTTATDWSGIVYAFGYTQDGKLGSVSASNGLSYRQNYNGTLPTDKTWKDGAGAVLAAFQSTYNDKGQLNGTASNVNGSSENNPIQWNANDQVSKTGTNPVTWQGNRVTATDRLQSLNYSATTGRLADTTDLTGNTTTFAYNAIGQRASSVSNGQTVNYSWNVLGQLTAAGSDAYAYDNSGLRNEVNNKQQVYGQDTKLLSDGTNKFLWSIDGALLAQAPLGGVAGAVPSQAVTNSMGSVYAMVQAQPIPNNPDTYQFAVQAQYSYSLFGERSLIAGTEATPIGYVSEQIDATTGFVYLRARYYDPKTAQFISSDPLLSKTLDEYGYAGGNPLQMIDPLGLSWIDITVGANVVGGFIYDNVDSISTLTTGAAIACAVSGVGAPLGAVLGLVSYGLNIVSTAKAVNEGDKLGIGLGVAGMILPGAGRVGKAVMNYGLTKTTASVMNGTIRTRREFNSAIGGYDSFNRFALASNWYSTGASTLKDNVDPFLKGRCK